MKIMLLVLLCLFVLFIVHLIHVGARREHFGTAAVEAIVVYGISNIPILALTLVSFLRDNENPYATVISNLKDVMNGGDVFIYVSALIAPVVWVLIARAREAHRVLAGLYWVLLLLIIVFSAFSFQEVRLTENINQNALDFTAIVLYCVSLMLWYGAIVYTRFVESYEPKKSGNSVLDGLQGGGK